MIDVLLSGFQDNQCFYKNPHIPYNCFNSTASNQALFSFWDSRRIRKIKNVFPECLSYPRSLSSEPLALRFRSKALCNSQHSVNSAWCKCPFSFLRPACDAQCKGIIPPGPLALTSAPLASSRSAGSAACRDRTEETLKNRLKTKLKRS
jgi:hypothetical protein